MVDGNEKQSSGMTPEQVEVFLDDFLTGLDRAASTAGSSHGLSEDKRDRS